MGGMNMKEMMRLMHEKRLILSPALAVYVVRIHDCSTIP